MSMRAPILFFAAIVLCYHNANAETLRNDPAILKILEDVVTPGYKLDGRLPGMVAGIQRAGQPIRIAAAGARKRGLPDRITVNDHVFIGSCGKAMTATLIAKLVDQGKLTWDTTLVQALPMLEETIHKDYKRSTIRDLLLHRSGLKRTTNRWRPLGPEASFTEQRLAVAKAALAKPAAQKRGQFEYSNIGYMIAGSIAEQAVGKPWEQVMEDELFKPLGMKTASYSDRVRGSIEQPWGHYGIVVKPRQRREHVAGALHLSLSDWAKFTQVHFGGDSNNLLSPQSLAELHRPYGRGKGYEYALGWRVYGGGFAKGAVLSHSGTNKLWYATVWVVPQMKTSYLVSTNIAGEKARRVCNQVILELINVDAGLPPREIVIDDAK